MPQTNTWRRVYVVGAYLPNGGTVMAYHLGRILERDFGLQAIAVSVAGETAEHGIHEYDLRMPSVSREQMEQEITGRDVLIVNPSFSDLQFGWRIPGFKISYVQDFKTFALLDRKFDHYVAVSDFVQMFLRAVYEIDVRVIPPFIHLEKLPRAPAWRDRPANLVLPYRKGMPEVWEQSWRRLREIVAERAPHIDFAEPVAASGIAQRVLFEKIAGARYFLTLSAAEGFGLVPLEAMALGATVVGYEGFGGRHYLRSGDNCAVAPYPQIERVAEMLIDAVGDPDKSESLAVRGRETAMRYSYAAFREAWIEEFTAALHMTHRPQH